MLKNILRRSIPILLFSALGQNLFATISISQTIESVTTPTTINLTTTYNSWAVLGSDGDIDILPSGETSDGNNDNRYEKMLNSAIFDIKSINNPRGCEMDQGDDSAMKFQFSDGTNKLTVDGEDSFRYLPLGTAFSIANPCKNSTIVLAIKESSGTIDIFLKNYLVAFDVEYYINSTLSETLSVESSNGYQKIVINFSDGTIGDTLKIRLSNFTYTNSWANIAFLAVGSSQESSFFSRDTNGVVTDNKRELQWQDNYSDNGGDIKIGTWSEALAYCESLTLGGSGDWRLPNIRELTSIVDESKYAPALDKTYFTESGTGVGYWSSTTFHNSNGNTSAVWLLNARSGINQAFDKASDTGHMICVKDK